MATEKSNSKISVDIKYLLPVLALIGAIFFFVFRDAVWWAKSGAVLWLLPVLLVIISILDPKPRAQIIRALRKPNFTQVYVYLMTRPLNWLWNRYCDPVVQEAGLAATFKASRTWRLYDSALLIAVIYPIASLVGFWALSGIWTKGGLDGRLGTAIILPAAPF